MGNSNLKMIGILVRLPRPYLRKLNELVARGKYPNVSEAIRMAVRDLLNEEREMERGIRIVIGEEPPPEN